MSDNNRTKNSLDEDGECDVRKAKAKRHDIELPSSADVDISLANKLDNILNVSGTTKPRFFTNKPKTSSENSSSFTKVESVNIGNGRLKARCLSKEELRQRLIKNYDTLVPELDPERPTVRVVKVLSTTEAIELGKIQAKKQLVQQLELNSVSGNQNAHANGLVGFRFNDGYEMSMNSDRPDQKNVTTLRSKIKNKLKIKPSKQFPKTVRFDDNGSDRTHVKRIEDLEEEADYKHEKSNRITHPSNVDDDDSFVQNEDDGGDDTTESDCSTTDARD